MQSEAFLILEIETVSAQIRSQQLKRGHGLALKYPRSAGPEFRDQFWVDLVAGVRRGRMITDCCL